MKQTFAAVLLALCLAQTVLSACETEGYYDYTGSNADIQCQQCAVPLKICVGDQVLYDEINSDAYRIQGGVAQGKCISSYYNSESGTCDLECKMGCSSCQYANDFCQECNQGYLWNSDYSCTPVVVPLQIATLILLVIALVGGIMVIVNNRS